MKLIFIKLFFTLMLLKTIESTLNRSKAKSKQLFEVMEKQMSSQNKSPIENQTKLNSLFPVAQADLKKNNIKSEIQNSQKNLFNSINFNQVYEKKKK